MNFLNKNPIRFDGKKEIQTKLRNQTDNVISRRFKILVIAVLVMGVLLLLRLFMTQITQQDYYTTKLSQYNTSVFTADTFRGNIYDRNGKRLVYNKNINVATYYSVKGMKDEEIGVIVKFLINNVNIDIENVTTRDKKDYLIMKDKKYVKSLLTEEELRQDDDTVYKLQLERITDKILKDKLSDDDIKYYLLFYKMKNTVRGSVALLEGLSIKEASIIGENSSLLRGIKVTNDWSREYTYGNNFRQVLGKVSTKKQGLPANVRDVLLAEDYNNDSRVGTSGLEAEYESILSGSSAKYSITYDASGNPIVQPVSSGSKGNDIRLTIDWDIQEALSKDIEAALKAHSGAGEKYNNNIFVVLVDPNNGEVIAMAGKQRNPKTGEISDYAAGNYLSAFAIGSTFKGGTIYSGFKNNVISKNTYILDSSQGLKIAGTNTKYSWRKSGLGNLNEVDALAQSSNIYMFHVAIRLGGGTYAYNQPLKINSEAFDTLRKDVGELGLGVKTGLDVPMEELGYRGKESERKGGNLLDFAIGQYDTYTPIQMAQYVSTIANSGQRVQPHLFLESFSQDSIGQDMIVSRYKTNVLDDVSNYTVAFERIREGFKKGGETGLARRANGSYKAAGKTGTAQVIESKTNIDYPNRAYVGYAPYDNPQVAVACMAERQFKNESCQGLAKSAFTKYFDKYGVKSK